MRRRASAALLGATISALVVMSSSVSAVSGGAPSDPTSTAVPAISPPDFPDDFVVPSGYETLVDDTGHLSVAVPEHWDDIDLEPFEFDGFEVPWINAATNLRVWDQTFAAPGVLYAAYPFDADVDAVYARFELTSGCAALEVVPYDDGAFSGQWWQHTRCGPEGVSEWHAIVASPASEAATVAIVVQLPTAADRPALDVVLQSFNFTPTATWPTATVATTTTSTTSTTTSTTSTTTSTIAPTTSTSTATSMPIGTRFIVDDTNLLSVTVPGSWTDVTTASGANDDGTDRPTILAAPDASRFLAGFDVPGTRIVALPPDVEPATVLANNAYSDNCASAGSEPFDNGRFVGLTEEWASCAGGDTSLTVVAARPPDSSFTILAEIQETSDDRSATSILDSIALVAGSTYSATTLPAPVTPVGVVPDTLLHGPVQPGAATVVDSSGSISVAVPADWSERRLGGTFNDDMSSRPRIIAAPDVDAMVGGWTTPGVIFVEYPYADDPAALLANLGWEDDCDDGGVQTFDNGTYTGYLQTWSACDGTETRIVSVAVSPADRSATLHLEVQLPTADDTPLQTVLASFEHR
jgi:hypothetical protein